MPAGRPPPSRLASTSIDVDTMPTPANTMAKATKRFFKVMK
jgi:hypothetical protein